MSLDGPKPDPTDGIPLITGEIHCLSNLKYLSSVPCCMYRWNDMCPACTDETQSPEAPGVPLNSRRILSSDHVILKTKNQALYANL